MLGNKWRYEKLSFKKRVIHNMEESAVISKNNVVAEIQKIKKYVKESHIPGQNHLDISLVDAEERDMFYKVMSIAQKAVKEAVITEQELKELLGL